MEQEIAKYWIEIRRDKRNPDCWPPEWEDVGVYRRKYFIAKKDRDDFLMSEAIKNGFTHQHGEIK